MKSIYNIETASTCNNSCSYCPYTKYVKGKREGIMSDKVWSVCLTWMKIFRQDMVWLQGFGEPLLDPKLLTRISQLNDMGIAPGFSTNGKLFTPALARQLGELHVRMVTISPHTPDSQAIVEDIISGHIDYGTGFISEKYPVHIKISDGFRNNPHNFAGQADGTDVCGQFYGCEFVRPGKCSILSDGRIVTCCIDAAPARTLGNILDADLSALRSEYFELCERCHAKKI